MEMYEKLYEEVVEEAIPEKKDLSKKQALALRLKQIWHDHGEEIIIGTIWTAAAVGSIAAIATGVHQDKMFNAAIREKYGDRVMEGNLLGGSIKKRWVVHDKWEKEDKKNFDEVLNFARQLCLKDEESYSIDRVVGDEGKMLTQVLQFTGGGFYHGELLD